MRNATSGKSHYNGLQIESSSRLIQVYKLNAYHQNRFRFIYGRYGSAQNETTRILRILLGAPNFDFSSGRADQNDSNIRYLQRGSLSTANPQIGLQTHINN